jgi:hypothetical protein
VTASVGAYQLERTGIHLFEKDRGRSTSPSSACPLLPLLGTCANKECWPHDQTPRLCHGPSGGAFALADAARLLAAHARHRRRYEFADRAAEKFEDFFRNLKPQRLCRRQHHQAAQGRPPFPAVDRREPAADKIGAVNTVWYEGDTLSAANTDWLGIVLSLDTIHPGWGHLARQGRRARRRRIRSRIRYGFLERASRSRSQIARSHVPALAADSGRRASAARIRRAGETAR